MHDAGSCHCGRIAFDLESDAPITEAYDCNCGSCRRRGGLRRFGMRAQFRTQAGPEALGTYRLNRQHIDHHHCPQCGSAPLGESLKSDTGEAGMAVSPRGVPGLDLAALSMHAVAGASR
ncbi:GFA family protein [Xanthomonas arboricola]|uniref:Aldehyde-activating protein n=1 Tax=Xanthomonas campestris pv. juglandis TaxID=195709 RepID=A0A8E4EMH4_XANCJ|nr:GFA family protein [Xanthomonas arboricola]OAH89345.1 aldehyde-activating protein [Xanthomonas arboricola pv. juglandis]CAD1789844.1 GFA family protein [Xanthomonas arboricola pv. juglandis]CAD7350965.1 GFA family protein [Xanthomonas arboricola]SUZ35892.1 aldehyde-activating protein [Xanthomonas arboricola pv. juglandis]SYZ59585.1 aldehyde-activating protein [Xanthomonas arboricola pv. juglandis]